MFAYVSNQFVPADKASLGINDLSILRGYGVFDFFRTRNNKPLFLEDYLDRFYQSAATLFLEPLPSKQNLTQIILELIEKNNLPESGVRLVLTGGFSSDGFTLSKPNLIVTQQPIKMPSAETFTNGVKVITHAYRRELPLVKSINYLMGVWLQHKVKAMNAFDVLYFDNDGVSEFPRANVFIVNSSGVLVTPVKNVLPGVTRKQVLWLAKNEIQVEEREITIEELKDANEVFITSTTRRLLPVNQIDDVIIGNGKAGPVCTGLYKSFMNLEEKNLL